MSWWIQVWGLTKREILRFLKVPFQAVGSPIITSALYLMIFGVGIGSYLQAPIGHSYLQFIIPGLITMGVVRGAYENTTSSVVASKYVNELQDLRVSPLSRWQIIIGLVLAATCRGILVSVVTYGVGMLFSLIYLGEPLAITHPFMTLYFLVVGAASFSALGLLLAMFARTFEQVSIFGSFVLVPLIYLGGVFFSLDMLSPFWQKIALINPIYYLIEGMRYSMISENTSYLFYESLFLLAFLLISSGLSFIVLKKGNRYVR